MKKLILFALILCMGKVYAQQGNNYSSQPRNYTTSRPNNSYTVPKTQTDDSFDQIRIIDSTQEIRADVTPYKNEPKIKNDRYYYWYYNNTIHSTQGGYNGQLLNGHYVAFYPNKDLKEEGDFKRGLKDGEWKTWNQKGDLTGVTNWDEGVQVPDSGQPFWKKIPLLNKKNDQQPQNQQQSGNQ